MRSLSNACIHPSSGKSAEWDPSPGERVFGIKRGGINGAESNVDGSGSIDRLVGFGSSPFIYAHGKRRYGSPSSSDFQWSGT